MELKCNSFDGFHMRNPPIFILATETLLSTQRTHLRRATLDGTWKQNELEQNEEVSTGALAEMHDAMENRNKKQ